MSRSQEKEEKCLLSGWCLVENTTNQDWEDISLSLVAGMPVSFIYDFYRPILIDRPKIQPPKVLSAKPTEIEEGLEREEYAEYPKTEAKKKKAKEKEYRAVSRAPAKPMAQPASTGALASLMEDVSGDFKR